MSSGDAVGGTRGEAGAGGSTSPVDLDGASNVLVLAPTMDDGARRSYFERLVPGEPSALEVLAVDYRRTPDEYLEEWRRNAGGVPRRCAIVSVDDVTRSAAASRGGTSVGPNAVVCAESPDDLTGVGIRIHQSLSELDGSPTVVSLDSLTVLLQYVELRRAFRFLHVLTNRVAEAEAVAHYHMDPDAHDAKTVATLESLFDAVVEYGDDGWSVDRR